MDAVQQAAYKYAVKNAFEHDGKAQTGAVVGKVKALFPDADLKVAMPLIAAEVKKANALSKGKLKEAYDDFAAAGWELVHVEKEKTLPALEWLAPGQKITTRVAPNPSGAMHFGHARPAVLTDEYVKRYGGTYLLRFDDTDPKTKTPVAGIEKEFRRDFDWLGIRFDSVKRASDRLARYYEIIQTLLAGGNAYVCDCDPEKWRALIWKSKPCPCRGKSAEHHLTQWQKMLAHEIKEEQAVVRLKTDLKHKDSATRDWWLAKVVDEVNHSNPAAKNRHVWPSYNLASAVDDHDDGINFIIRGQEHVGNEEKQRALYVYFGWTYPHTAYFGKVSKIGDMTLSKSKMKEIMDAAGIERYDDPRMATIASFRRRGFAPGAVRKVIVDCGVSLKEVKITLESLAAANKTILGEAREFPFFDEAVAVEALGIAPGDADCYGEKVHFEQGFAKLFVDKKELLAYAKKKQPLVRLKRAFNATLSDITAYGAKATFVSYAKTDHPTLSWVHELVDVSILMADGTLKKGFSAPSLLDAAGVIRFEGIGYANIEAKENGIVSCVFSYA